MSPCLQPNGLQVSMNVSPGLEKVNNPLSMECKYVIIIIMVLTLYKNLL
jgi:hypothetical protein